MAEETATKATQKRIEYFPNGNFPNDRYLECHTGYTVGDTRHAVSFYLRIPDNDAEAQEFYKIPLKSLILMGLRQGGYLVKSENYLKAEGAIVDGNLRQDVIDAIQQEANELTFEKRERVPKQAAAQKAKLSLAQEAGFENVEELMAAIAKLKAKQGKK